MKSGGANRHRDIGSHELEQRGRQMTLSRTALVCILIAPISVPAQQVAAPTGGQQMEISRDSTRETTVGPSENFSGTARITLLFGPKGPSQVSAAAVSFEPGARTAWHMHPLGQRLVITDGTGWTQVEGGPIEEVRKGDVVWCPPNVRHWHGATDISPMTHMAIQEYKDGKPVEWMEHVSEKQYLAARN
jgi:quercetin dioxygenase-like cupin family protein